MHWAARIRSFLGISIGFHVFINPQFFISLLIKAGGIFTPWLFLHPSEAEGKWPHDVMQSNKVILIIKFFIIAILYFVLKLAGFHSGRVLGESFQYCLSPHGQLPFP